MRGGGDRGGSNLGGLYCDITCSHNKTLTTNTTRIETTHQPVSSVATEMRAATQHCSRPKHFHLSMPWELFCGAHGVLDKCVACLTRSILWPEVALFSVTF